MADWSAVWGKLKGRIRGLFSGGSILCDRCKLNYGNVCVRPERPNATSCEDFIPK